MSKAEEKSQRTILVAEDFEDTRRVMCLWLRRLGYRVVEAVNGLEAISMARQERPDLIIMDIEMPHMDGLEATRRIREQEEFRDVAIVAVSAYGAEQFRAKAIAAGCTDYVSTPFEPEELKNLINGLLA